MSIPGFFGHPPTSATRRVIAILAIMLLGSAIIASAQDSAPSTDDTTHAWQQVSTQPSDFSPNGHPRAVHPRKFRSFTLNHGNMRSFVASAPRERTKAARDGKMVLSLPEPGGTFQRLRFGNRQ